MCEGFRFAIFIRQTIGGKPVEYLYKIFHSQMPWLKGDVELYHIILLVIEPVIGACRNNYRIANIEYLFVFSDLHVQDTFLHFKLFGKSIVIMQWRAITLTQIY